MGDYKAIYNFEYKFIKSISKDNLAKNFERNNNVVINDVRFKKVALGERIFQFGYLKTGKT